MARHAALSAAVRGQEAWEARAGLPVLSEQQESWDTLPKALQRERTAREALGRAPERSRLEGEIARAMRRFLPHEIEDLRRAVAQPQFAAPMKIREAAREALLGREGHER